MRYGRGRQMCAGTLSSERRLGEVKFRSLLYTFPPYSVTLLVLKPAPPVNWGTAVGLGLAVAVFGGLGYRLWRRSVVKRGA